MLCAIVLLASIVKKFNRPGSPLAVALGSARSPAGILTVLGRYPLARGHTLILVKIERHILLLGVTAGRLRSGGGSVSTLATIDDPEDVASILLKAQDADGAATADRFRELLDRFDSTHGDGVEVVDDARHLRRSHIGDDGDRVELWDDRPDALPFTVDGETSVRPKLRGGRR